MRGGWSATSARSPWSGLPFVGFVDAGHARSSSSCRAAVIWPSIPRPTPIPVLGGIDRLDELVDRARATDVVVAVSGKPGLPRRGPQLTQLSNSDVAVHWVLVDSGRLDLGTLCRARFRHRPNGTSHSPMKRIAR